MTLAKLASEIAKREGKKSQARIGDIREILKVLAQLDAEYEIENATQSGGPLDTIGLAADKIGKRILKKKK